MMQVRGFYERLQECRFCRVRRIPKTAFRGDPVCTLCAAEQCIPIPFKDADRQRAKNKPLITDEQITAIISHLSSGPTTTSEIAYVTKQDKSRVLKQMRILVKRGLIVRSGGSSGRSCWWALPKDISKCPNLKGICSRKEQFLEILRACGSMSAESLICKLGIGEEFALDLGQQLVREGLIASHTTGEILYFTYGSTKL